MEPLIIAIQFSDLFEATQTEGGRVAALIDTDIIPHLREDLHEANGLKLGNRFVQVLNKVKAIVGPPGADAYRRVKQMMEQVIDNYIKRTNDIQTGRHIFSHAIHKGLDEMLTVTAAGLLANALAAVHPQQSMLMMRTVSRSLGGDQSIRENASGAAVGAGAIAGVAMGAKAKKRRKDSIFAEAEQGHLHMRAAPETGSKVAFATHAGGHAEVEDHLANLQSHIRDKRLPAHNVSIQNTRTGEVHHAKVGPEGVYKRSYSNLDEGLSLDDLQDVDRIKIFREIASGIENRYVDGILIDPDTAEMVIAAHLSTSGKQRKVYEGYDTSEMVEYAKGLFDTGELHVVIERD